MPTTKTTPRVRTSSSVAVPKILSRGSQLSRQIVLSRDFKQHSDVGRSDVRTRMRLPGTSESVYNGEEYQD
jgi:hypothetical protein